jgi:hypothetical protein
MRGLGLLFLISSCWTATGYAAECDEFVSLVAPAKTAYQKEHRIYPVPDAIKALAQRYMPRLWVHPQSWHPISFEDYLDRSRLIRNSDGHVLRVRPSIRSLSALDFANQCATYLKSEEIKPQTPAPVYIQVFWDQNPAIATEKWTYIKYNLVFDWSGLAKKINWYSRLGVLMSGGDADRWHRLDVHTAVILAFDSDQRLRLLTLAQHNHQHTYMAGVDLPANARPMLVAAVRSNELYLDHGDTVPVSHRVVPFFNKVAYLIDPDKKPLFWATDITFGRHAGGKEIPLKPVFIVPGHPLADYAGLLAPADRFLGMYTGRDGPPGYNYYAPPAYISLVNFAAMGYWQAGDLELLKEITPFIDDLRNTDWREIVQVMRGRLADAILKHPVLPSQGALDPEMLALNCRDYR